MGKLDDFIIKQSPAIVLALCGVGFSLVAFIAANA
jgi:hypothetical protein